MQNVMRSLISTVNIAVTRDLSQPAMGKMWNCGMRKVKCGMKNAERCRLVSRSDHVTAAIPQFTTRRARTAQ